MARLPAASRSKTHPGRPLCWQNHEARRCVPARPARWQHQSGRRGALPATSDPDFNPPDQALRAGSSGSLAGTVTLICSTEQSATQAASGRAVASWPRTSPPARASSAGLGGGRRCCSTAARHSWLHGRGDRLIRQECWATQHESCSGGGRDSLRARRLAGGHCASAAAAATGADIIGCWLVAGLSTPSEDKGASAAQPTMYRTDVAASGSQLPQNVHGLRRR